MEFGTDYAAEVRVTDGTPCTLSTGDVPAPTCAGTFSLSKYPLGRLSARITGGSPSSDCVHYITQWNGADTLELAVSGYMSCSPEVIFKSTTTAMGHSAQRTMIVRYSAAVPFGSVSTSDVLCGLNSAPISFPACSATDGYITSASITLSTTVYATFPIAISKVSGRSFSGYKCNFNIARWGTANNFSTWTPPPKKTVSDCVSSSTVVRNDVQRNFFYGQPYEFEFEVFDASNTFLCFLPPLVVNEPAVTCPGTESEFQFHWLDYTRFGLTTPNIFPSYGRCAVFFFDESGYYSLVPCGNGYLYSVPGFNDGDSLTIYYRFYGIGAFAGTPDCESTRRTQLFKGYECGALTVAPTASLQYRITTTPAIGGPPRVYDLGICTLFMSCVSPAGTVYTGQLTLSTCSSSDVEFHDLRVAAGMFPTDSVCTFHYSYARWFESTHICTSVARAEATVSLLGCYGVNAETALTVAGYTTTGAFTITVANPPVLTAGRTCAVRSIEYGGWVNSDTRTSTDACPTSSVFTSPPGYSFVFGVDYFFELVVLRDGVVSCKTPLSVAPELCRDDSATVTSLTVSHLPEGKLRASLASIGGASSECAFVLWKWNWEIVKELVLGPIACDTAAHDLESTAEAMGLGTHAVQVMRVPAGTSAGDFPTTQPVCGTAVVSVSTAACSFDPETEASLTEAHDSYAPVVRLARASASPTITGSIIQQVMGSYSCYSCYSELAVELAGRMRPAVRNACVNEYTQSCHGAITPSLTTFTTCSGITLPSSTANHCTAIEWDKIRAGRLITDLVNILGSKSDTQSAPALIAMYTQLMTRVQTTNPTLSFACDKCFRKLITALAIVPAATIRTCSKTPANCSPALASFQQCSGFALPFQYTLACDAEEFREVDATFGAYSEFMTSALAGKPVSGPITDAYSRLSCRTCFDSFYTTISANRATLTPDGVAGPCGSSRTIHSIGPDSSKCIDTTNVGTIVYGALLEMTNCAGAGNALWTKLRNTASSAQERILNDAVRIFDPVVECAVSAGSPGDVFGAPASAWKTCLSSYSPVVETISDSEWYCYQNLGTEAATVGSVCADAFSDGCRTQLTGALLDFFHCSGYELDTAPTQCSVQEREKLPLKYRTFIPMLDEGMWSTGVDSAVSRVYGWSDLVLVPCVSCYAVLSAELWLALQDSTLRRLCTNPYGEECVGMSLVAGALARFTECTGGLKLSTESPFKSTSAEWEALGGDTLSRQVFDLIVYAKASNILSALFAWKKLEKSINPSSETIKCFQDLIIDFDPVPPETVDACSRDITSIECVAGGAMQPLQKFEKCSGNPFVLSKTVEVADKFELVEISDPPPEKSTDGFSLSVLDYVMGNSCSGSLGVRFLPNGQLGIDVLYTELYWDDAPSCTLEFTMYNGVAISGGTWDPPVCDVNQDAYIYTPPLGVSLGSMVFGSRYMANMHIDFPDGESCDLPLDDTSTGCSGSDLVALTYKHESYAWVVSAALAAGYDYTEASNAIMSSSSQVAALVPDSPCLTCYARMASELSDYMGDDDRSDCSNVYSESCFENAVVTAAIAQFTTCSRGLTLPDISARTCTSAEWDILRAGRVVMELIGLLIGKSDSVTGSELISSFSSIFSPIKVRNSGRVFACETCFDRFLTVIAPIPSSVIRNCLNSVDSCITTGTEGEDIRYALAAFVNCSGGLKLPLRYTMPCTADEFLRVDADHGAYGILMAKALYDRSVSTEYSDGYSMLGCRACFVDFENTISSAKAGLVSGADFSGGLCGTAATIHSDGCVGAITSALDEFELCAGTGNRLWTDRREPVSIEQKLILDTAARIYESVVECGAAADPGVTFGSPSNIWRACMNSRSPVFAALTTDSGAYCSQLLAKQANGVGGCSDAFGSCLTQLQANTSSTQLDSPLMDFYRCSGFPIATADTRCSATQLSVIPDLFRSFVPFMEIVFLAEDITVAVKRTQNLVAGISAIPCSSCFASLAAELFTALNASPQLKSVCTTGIYSVTCTAASGVVNALTRFRACSGGLELSTESPYKSSDQQWAALEGTGIASSAFNFVVFSKQMNIFSALLYWRDFQKEFIAANPSVNTNALKCYENLIIGFDPVPADVVYKCSPDPGSSECLSGGGIDPLSVFIKCSGHEFDSR